MSMIKIFLVSILLLSGFGVLKSQDIKLNTFKDLDLLEASKDTVKKKSSEVKFVMKKSPLKAVLLSAALPGLGQ